MDSLHFSNLGRSFYAKRHSAPNTANALAISRIRGLKMIQQAAQMVEVMCALELAPQVPEGNQRMTQLGVAALCAVTKWVAGLAKESRFSFPQRAEILRRYLSSEAYSGVRWEVC